MGEVNAARAVLYSLPPRIPAEGTQDFGARNPGGLV